LTLTGTPSYNERIIITAALNARTADVKSLTKVKLVVSGVIGDRKFGPDSALYGSMGYARKSGRKVD